MNTKAFGEISEGVILAHLLKAGYSVAIPFGNNQRYDLIVDDSVQLLKAQCKTGRRVNGCIYFQTCSKNGFTGERRDYHGQIDIFLVYFPETGSVYKVPVAHVGKATGVLRIDPVKGTSSPKSTIRMAADYLM